MTEPTTPPPAPDADAPLPEAVAWSSAAVDGEATGAAPVGADAATFAAAAAAIGSVPPLDEVTRARLVRGALAALDTDVPAATPTSDPAVGEAVTGGNVEDLLAHRARRRPRWLAPAGAAAASVALAVGVLAAGGGDRARDAAEGDTADKAAETATVAELGPVPELGEVSDPVRLRNLVTGDAAYHEETGRSTASMESESLPESDLAPTQAGSNLGGAATLVDDACLATLNPGGVVPTIIGTGTHEGRAVVVAAAEEPGRTLVFVVADGCVIVDNQQIATG